MKTSKFPPDNSKKSIRKSQQRSPIATPISSVSNSSLSDVSSQNPPKFRRRNNSNLIYAPEKDVVLVEKDGSSLGFSVWMQSAITVIVLLAWCYHLFFGDSYIESWVLVKQLVLELTGCLLLLHVSTNYFTGPCCSFLAYQYCMLFISFSSLIHSEYMLNGSLLDHVFSVVSMSTFATMFHLMITLETMNLIGTSEKRNDYSDRLIVESKEKRAGDMYKMISKLLAYTTCGNQDLKVDLTITDETGRPVNLSGVDVAAGVNRSTELTLTQDEVELTTTKSAAALVNVPHKKTDGSQDISEAAARECNLSKYNLSQKQDQMLSPLKVL